MASTNWAANCLGIANVALTLVGTRLLSSYTDNSKECVLISTNWDFYRLAVLRDGFYNCATNRAVLTQNQNYTAPFGFTNQFLLPPDFVRVKWLMGDSGPMQDDTSAYRIENGNLLTNMSQINLVYVFNLINPALMDPLLSDAFAAYIAKEICYSLTNSDSLKQDMQKEYKLRRQRALFVNGAENPAEVIDADIWLRARMVIPSFPRDPGSITFVPGP